MHDANSAFFDLESDASWIDNHLGLMQWIELARKLLSDIQDWAEIDKELAEQLQEHSIRYNLDWSDRESAGLYQLTEDVAQAAHRAIATAREVSHG